MNSAKSVLVETASATDARAASLNNKSIHPSKLTAALRAVTIGGLQFDAVVDAMISHIHYSYDGL